MIQDINDILKKRGFRPLVASFLVPILVCCGLGIWQSFELGIAGVLGMFVVGFWVGYLIVSFIMKRRTKPATSSDPLPRSKLLESLGPAEGWTTREVAVFRSFKQKINVHTQTLIDWAELPTVGRQIADEAIRELSSGKRDLGALTAPQMLLLIERLAARYRLYLKTNVPFSDTVNLSVAQWVTENREMLEIGWKTVRRAQQAASATINAPVFLAAEWLKQVALGNKDLLQEGLLPELQTILLEEVVRSAIDLEGGRLRYSELELQAERLASTDRDQANRIPEDDPLRVIVVGQVSSGKSSLINALSGAGTALTDSAPTQTTIETHSFKIDTLDATLVDTPGIDGTAETNELLAQEIQEADLCLWVSKANRPGRKYDQELQDFVDQWFADHHQHRKPAIIRVLSHVDGIDGVELNTSGTMSYEDSSVIGAMVNQVKTELGDAHVVPVVFEPNVWNLDALTDALKAQALSAINVQRSRKRHQRDRQAATFGAFAGKSGGAVKEAFKLSKRVLSRSKTDKIEG